MFELLKSLVGAKVIFFIFLFVVFFCFCYFDIFCNQAKLESIEITVKKEKESSKFRLLCDSGCMVREPFSDLPVILISAEKFDKLYPEIKNDDVLCAVKYKKRTVPVKTATGNGLIYAVCPEKITYTYNNKIHLCNAMLGRSTNDSFAGYDGLFPKNIL